MFAFELSKGTGLGGPSLEEMVAIGANYGPLTRHGQAWRLLTAMFLHGGPLHVGMNMVCLYQVAIVERLLGRAEFFALYFAAGLVGGLASVATHPDTVSLGASGAVFGMFGAFAAIMVVRRKQMAPEVWGRTMRNLAAFFGINLVFGLAQRGIDLSAHVGGLAAGFVGAFVLAKSATPGSGHVLRAVVVATLGLGIALVGLYALPA
jgi:rhomboid protease GluP